MFKEFVIIASGAVWISIAGAALYWVFATQLS
jgi:hypothetical protein